jgi:DNA (cytosine-5)-methyltransferase 1
MNESPIGEPLNGFTVLDLFCGAGGLSLGFQQAGFTVVSAVDHNKAALETYERNVGAHVAEVDLSYNALLPPATVVIGGPPCQGFSSAGLRRADDHRNSLVSCFAQLVARLRPKAFVFENVEGFLTAESGKRIFELLDPLIAAGYQIHLRKINAANFGVPQHRKRVIAIGGLGWKPSFPEPTHSAYGAPGAKLGGKALAPTPSVVEALGDLPPASTEEPGTPHGHHFRPLQGVDLLRASALKPGENMRHLPEELQHESYRRRAFRRVKDGTPTERRGGAPFGVRRLKSDEPSKAITGGARSEFIHPFETRPLTIRECARLQTFPDHFIFMGNVSDQAQLIGNAVPPMLARTIATLLAKDLLTLPSKSSPGQLITFVPTLSSGFSPVLRQVTTMVKERFLSEPVEEPSLWR